MCLGRSRSQVVGTEGYTDAGGGLAYREAWHADCFTQKPLDPKAPTTTTPNQQSLLGTNWNLFLVLKESSSKGDSVILRAQSLQPP